MQSDEFGDNNKYGEPVPSINNPQVPAEKSDSMAKGSLGKHVSPAMTTQKYSLLLGAFIAFSVGGGYMAATQPPDAGWRFFSWHPFLMTVGMVGLAGIGAVTKKLGGYTNTKLHGMLGWASIFASFAGLYCIYRNKENNGYEHLKTVHSRMGAFVVLNCVALGLAGGIFLHPDFGVDKTNKTIRLAHKTASRLVLLVAWMTAFSGLLQLTQNYVTLTLYALPLIGLVPFTLM